MKLLIAVPAEGSVPLLEFFGLLDEKQGKSCFRFLPFSYNLQRQSCASPMSSTSASSVTRRSMNCEPRAKPGPHHFHTH